MQYIANSHNRANIHFSRGSGMNLFDSDGKKYLDFAAGVAVNALGHCHPVMVNAIRKQSQKLWHVSNLFRCQEAEGLAELLCKTTGAKNVFFSNSGSEAVEAMIKMTRRFHHLNGNTHKNEIIAFHGAFHGRSICNITAGGNEKYIEGYEPRLPGFIHAEFGNIEDVLSKISENTAGILIEPIQGEGGVHFIGWEFLKSLRKICDEKGILLILDEVQCGCSRTGKFFAYEWAEILPDAIATAKGLGGGFPIGATLFWDKMQSVISPGAHGSTFGGNPLATSVAFAVCKVLSSPDFLQNVNESARSLSAMLDDVVSDFSSIAEERRGFGLLKGLKIAGSIQVASVNEALKNAGLLTVSTSGNVLRFVPPLIVSKEDISKAYEIVKSVFKAL